MIGAAILLQAALASAVPRSGCKCVRCGRDWPEHQIHGPHCPACGHQMRAKPAPVADAPCANQATRQPDPEPERRHFDPATAAVAWAYSPWNAANAPSDTFSGGGGGTFDGGGASGDW